MDSLNNKYPHPFQVGVRVKLEMDEKEKFPRLDMGSTSGSIGQFVDGVVYETVRDRFTVKYDNKGVINFWIYRVEDQYCLGFPILLDQTPQECKQSDIVCTCDIVINGCYCGAFKRERDAKANR